VLVVECHDVAPAGERRHIPQRKVRSDGHVVRHQRGAVSRRFGEHPERHAEPDRGLRGHPRELSAADHAHDRHPAAGLPRDRPGWRLTYRPRRGG
jgi:hypothetical protein